MIRIFFITIFAAWIITDSYAQNPNRIEQAKESRCARKYFCEDFYGDYDYRGQSSYGEFSPGDTVRVKIIVYSGQDYRIFACGHKDLGDIQMKIIEPVKTSNKVVKDVKKEEIIEYEQDEYGSYKVDDQGKMIIKTRKTVYDTIYERQTVIKEKLLFDSMNNKDNLSYWDTTVKSTKRLVLEVIVPDGDKDIFDCVNVYIGRMASRVKGTSRF